MPLQRTIICFEVLSENPLPPDLTLGEIYEETISGSFSGRELSRETTEPSPAEMAKLLIEQGSDPEFFDLDEHGPGDSQ
jgi:hypothetical protein